MKIIFCIIFSFQTLLYSQFDLRNSHSQTENSIFDGEDAILAWISDDENKIPLKVEAEMFIGHAGIELAEYSGLRNTPALLDD